MKKLLSLLALTALTLVYSQSKTNFLDANFAPTAEGKHAYYQIAENPENPEGPYPAKTYFLSGKLFSEATYEDSQLRYKQGAYTSYYENGNVKSRCSYDKNRLNGKYETWYESGARRSEEEYFPPAKPNGGTTVQKVWNFWDSDHVQTVTDGNGQCELRDTEFGDICSGTIKNAMKDGRWTGSYKNNSISYIEDYADGKLVSGVTTDEKGKKHNYTIVLEHPKPKKGIQDFYQYIGQNFRSPKPNVTGLMLLRFVIDSYGDATDFKVLKSIDDAFDREGIRVIKRYPDWESGKYRGMDVRLEYTIPIRITESK